MTPATAVSPANSGIGPLSTWPSMRATALYSAFRFARASTKSAASTLSAPSHSCADPSNATTRCCSPRVIPHQPP